jgi:hypothetical protein
MRRKSLFAALCLIALLIIGPAGCVGGQFTTGAKQGFMTGATVFSEGAKWVMAVTDSLAPTLCQSGSIGAVGCVAYPMASASLKMLTDRLDAAVMAHAVSGASQDAKKVAELQAQAEVLYKTQIEPIYKGQSPGEVL